MEQEFIRKGRQFVKSCAATLPLPRFYRDNYRYISIAQWIATASSFVRYCSRCMYNKGTALGHSFYHAEKVAIESAAIVLKERGASEHSIHLAVLALMAGYFHDYFREMSDHPSKAAEYVQNHFYHFIPEDDVLAISFAIQNHEAFKEHQQVDNDDLMLLSNALYDADKFRWGPDNFLYTIWDMVATLHISHNDIVMHFSEGVAHIDTIRHTFRSKTGIQYGPEFIDHGLVIAKQLKNYLEAKE
ncbi:MAG TPA: hypothetical protein PLH80_01855 [Spirochaetota bacterium]|nr:hypothetical protein [Spirochaetota bacterium]HQI37294.1 hypothetical protein [Spirochaetota bacterium]HQK07763.1 hypothetical protein [Spirochaetota bacterium]